MPPRSRRTVLATVVARLGVLITGIAFGRGSITNRTEASLPELAVYKWVGYSALDIRVNT